MLNSILLGASGGNSWTMILLIVVMFGALWLFSIRPQKKREKEQASMQNSVDVGDKIVTIGGVSGKVISVREDDEDVVIETGGDKTRLRVKRWAIQTRVLTPDSVDKVDDEDDDYDDDDDAPVKAPEKKSLFGFGKKKEIAPVDDDDDDLYDDEDDEEADESDNEESK